VARSNLCQYLMRLASPIVVSVYRPTPTRPETDEHEIWSPIAFSRGLLVGFVGAFFVFDWVLLGAETTLGVLRGVQHVALAML
jgi:hypothetical protein